MISKQNKNNYFLAGQELTTFSYRLPSNSYVIFRLQHRQPSSLPSPRSSRGHLIESRSTQTCNWSGNLNAKFPLCSDSIFNCDYDAFGQCLVEKYPQVQDLPQKQHQLLPDNSECTDFVREFFPLCASYISTCEEMKDSVAKAKPMLGCLFANYWSLMLPLFKSRQWQSAVKPTATIRH